MLQKFVYIKLSILCSYCESKKKKKKRKIGISESSEKKIGRFLGKKRKKKIGRKKKKNLSSPIIHGCLTSYCAAAIFEDSV